MRSEAEARRISDEKAAGRDVVVPLDIYTTVADVGGSAVTIKIQDNDISSFDAWINGRHLANIPKEKGISHTRHDETFIYRNGAASLYYVWEISGQLNSCLLRVREE